MHDSSSATKTPLCALGRIRAARCPSRSVGAAGGGLWCGWRLPSVPALCRAAVRACPPTPPAASSRSYPRSRRSVVACGWRGGWSGLGRGVRGYGELGRRGRGGLVEQVAGEVCGRGAQVWGFRVVWGGQKRCKGSRSVLADQSRQRYPEAPCADIVSNLPRRNGEVKEASDTSWRAQSPRIFRNLFCAYYIKLGCEGAGSFWAGLMILNIPKRHLDITRTHFPENRKCYIIYGHER